MSDRPNSPPPPFPHSLEFINCTPSSPISYGETFIVKQEVDEESFILNQEENIKFEPDPLCIEPAISDTEGTLIKSEDGIKVEDPKPCYETVIYSVQIEHKIKNGKKIYICPECKKSRKRKEDLVKHILERHRYHQNRTCKFCSENFPAFSLLRDHLKSHKNIFICTVCEFYTNIRNSFRRHLSIHDLTLYKCKICHKSCYTVKELKSHVKEFHMEQDTFNCAHCCYSNNKKSLLKVHIISQHFSKLLYRCNLCTCGFISKSEFKKHHQGHGNGNTYTNKSGEQIYCCKFCLYTSKFLTVLKKHMVTCNNKAFKKTNNTYQCKKCTDVFENARELRIHQREKHLNIKKFECEYCEYVTCRKKVLDRHFEVNHMVGRPEYKCSLCPYVTSVKVAWFLHEKNHGKKARRRYECSRCKFYTSKFTLFYGHLRKFKH